MDCPVCGQTRYRGKGSNKMWSDAQWNRSSPRVDELHMNCCKLCADFVGTYFTKADSKTHPYDEGWGPSRSPGSSASSSDAGGKPTGESARSRSPPPHPTPPASDPPPQSLFKKHELENDWQVSKGWLRANVPTHFWELFKNHLVNANIQHREELKEINRHFGQNHQTSLLKHMSYYGAIEIPDAVPDGSVRVDFTMVEVDGTRRNYFDPGNYCYLCVFRMIWPAALPDISNHETMGDVLEAFLGYHWTLTYERMVTFPDTIKDIVEMLTMAVFNFWALD